jgi:hypothetical protein
MNQSPGDGHFAWFATGAALERDPGRFSTLFPMTSAPNPASGDHNPFLSASSFGAPAHGQTNGQASLLEPLIPLFAPYCGGVAYQGYLEPAVAQLLQGEWSGQRAITDGSSHSFVLSWQGELAPMENLDCSLRFPALPNIGYSFTMPAYQLVYWLMQRQAQQLPVAFWRWLFTGELPSASEGVVG